MSGNQCIASPISVIELEKASSWHQTHKLKPSYGCEAARADAKGAMPRSVVTETEKYVKVGCGCSRPECSPEWERLSVSKILDSQFGRVN